MNYEELQNAMKNVKRGKYTHVVFTKTTIVEGKTYTKTTDMVVRFVDYNNIKKVQEKKALKSEQTNTKASTIKNVIYMGNNITYNINKDTYYLGMATTQNNIKSAHSTYACDNTIITKEDYEQANPSKSGTIDLWLTKKVEDIVSIG